MRNLIISLAAASALAASAAAAAEPTRARSNLAGLFADLDYPPEAVRAREEGIVEFVLNVAASGRVAGCTVTRSSGSATLDSATCRMLTARARFTPARDSAGAPQADRVAGKVAWKLPAPAPAPAG